MFATRLPHTWKVVGHINDYCSEDTARRICHTSAYRPHPSMQSVVARPRLIIFKAICFVLYSLKVNNDTKQFYLRQKIRAMFLTVRYKESPHNQTKGGITHHVKNRVDRTLLWMVARVLLLLVKRRIPYAEKWQCNTAGPRTAHKIMM